MRKHIRHSATLGFAVAAGIFMSAAVAQAQQPAPTPAPAPAPEEAAAPEVCEVALEAASVPVNAEPVAVTASYSQEIGETVTAQVPAESGIKVVSAEADPATPMTLKLTLDTSAAAAGEWDIALSGDSGACTGRIAVTPASAPPSR